MTFENLRDRIRETPLTERLKHLRKEFLTVVTGQGVETHPRMSIPVQYTDLDIQTTTTIDDAIAMLEGHTALVDAAWKVIIAHQMGHETPEQADKVWAEEKASLLNLQTALEALTNDQPPGDPPKGKRLLVRVRNQRNGKYYNAIAVYYGPKSLELHDELEPFDGCVYDEDADMHYCPEGWYESPWSDGYEAHYKLDVMSWQELPGEGGEV